MKNSSSYWWLGIFTGIIFIFIGWLLLTNTAITTLRLVQILGLYWLISGVIGVVVSIFSQSVQSRGWKLAGSLLGIIAGLVVLNNPITSSVFTVAFLTYLIAFTFIFNGVIRMFLGRETEGSKFKWSFGGLILGVIYILVGLSMLGNTAFSAQVLVRTVGFLAVIGGIVGIASSFMFKGEAA